MEMRFSPGRFPGDDYPLGAFDAASMERMSKTNHDAGLFLVAELAVNGNVTNGSAYYGLGRQVRGR